MIGWNTLRLSFALPFLLIAVPCRAQDVPGIEICTVEKTMERRTSCLQSNVEFLQKSISRLLADHQQKLETQRAQIESLKATVISLQKTVDDLVAAQKKMAQDTKKADKSAGQDAAAPVKEGAK
jgi:septal ring factor EnvC (AmiA/AmiB activator)